MGPKRLLNRLSDAISARRRITMSGRPFKRAKKARLNGRSENYMSEWIRFRPDDTAHVWNCP